MLVFIVSCLAVLAIAAGPVWAGEAQNPAKTAANDRAEGLVRDGITKYQAGDPGGALADFNKALDEQKDLASAHYARAAVQLVMGKFTDASDTLQKWVAMNQADTYAWMLAYIANARGGNADRATLSSMQAITEENSWLGQTLALYMDTMTPDAYVKNVKEMTTAATGKKMEAAVMARTHFVVGEALLLKGDKDGAAKHFKMAVDATDSFQWEREMAKSELQRLGQPGSMGATPAAPKPAAGTNR
jgi:lipoprotein NlpI